jgi:anti-sigma B factor antagonist
MELVITDLYGARGQVLPAVMCSGDLDIATTEVFTSTVKRLLAEPGVTVIVNMESVPFVDSTGIGAMISCHKAAVEAGSECRFVINVPKVLRVVEATKINEFLNIYESSSSATDVI